MIAAMLGSSQSIEPFRSGVVIGSRGQDFDDDDPIVFLTSDEETQ